MTKGVMKFLDMASTKQTVLMDLTPRSICWTMIYMYILSSFGWRGGLNYSRDASRPVLEIGILLASNMDGC